MTVFVRFDRSGARKLDNLKTWLLENNYSSVTALLPKRPCRTSQFISHTPQPSSRATGVRRAEGWGWLRRKDFFRPMSDLQRWLVSARGWGQLFTQDILFFRTATKQA